MGALERRFTPGKVQLRTTAGKPAIGGYASVFNKTSRNLGGFVEVVNPAFFNKSAGDGWPDVMARWNHDDAYLLGTTASCTLSLQVDRTGLIYQVIPPQSRADVVELVTRGDIAHSSFAFRVFTGGDEWGTTENGFAHSCRGSWWMWHRSTPPHIRTPQPVCVRWLPVPVSTWRRCGIWLLQASWPSC